MIIGFSCKNEYHTDSILLTQNQDSIKVRKSLDFPNPCDRHSERSEESKTKKIYLNESLFVEAKNINGYLLDAPDIFIESRTKPLCNVPAISKGCQPTDGGNLIIEEKDYDDFIKKEPNAKKFIKKLVGAQEFINNKKCYCLWLVGANPSELKKNATCHEAN